MSTDPHLELQWSGRWSLTTRILAVNILALALLAGSFFYLDSYRTRLLESRVQRARTEVRLMADAIAVAEPAERDTLIVQFGQEYRRRIRLFEGERKVLDSFDMGPPGYRLRNPEQEPWKRHAARWLDEAFDWVVGRPHIDDFVEPVPGTASRWPEMVRARAAEQTAIAVRLAPDSTPMIITATPVPHSLASSPQWMLVTENARDVTKTTRSERFRLGMVLAGVTLGSVLLSLFLARTIVQPLRRLARAADRVKLGRQRDVMVPRLPSRRDEIGYLARSLADMTQTLRSRIDASETFAADLTHELKNPLASLRSAVETLGKVDDPALRAQLLDIVQHDSERLDRLITDIAEISRLDAELTRTRFDKFDLGLLIEELVNAWSARQDTRNVRFAYARQQQGTVLVRGDKDRLARVFHNLIDNAQSFSPNGGLVTIGISADDNGITIRVTDEGPGIAPESRETIFRRFHSDRPDGASFGRHSGLGLAIARTILEGHGGSIRVDDRDDAHPGACFRVDLPSASAT